MPPKQDNSQQQAPVAAPYPQTPLPNDIMQGQESKIRAEQKQAAPTSHMQPPMVNPKYTAPSMGQALKGMIPVIGGAMKEGIQAKKQAEVNRFAMRFQQLDAEWTKAQQLASGDEKKAMEMFKASPTYQSLFNAHDPKAYKDLKMMTEIFTAPWLEDGEASPAKKGYDKHMALKNAQQQTEFMQRMQQQFQQSLEAQPQEVGKEQSEQANRSITATTGAKREERLENKPDISFQKDGQGNWTALDKRTNTAKSVMIDRGDGKGSVPLTAAATGKNGTLTVDGMPVGVYKNGQAIRPGDQNWTPEDARHLAMDKAAYDTAEQGKLHRQEIVAQVRGQAYGDNRQYSVVDTTTGSVTMASGKQLRENPGQYAGSSPAMQMTNRRAIFDEIDSTGQQLTQAINEMGDAPFPQEARAKLALVLSQPDSESAESAWGSFLKSNVADTLTDGQMRYATALLSMQESAMALGGVGGLGRGTNKVRTAVQAMLPGAGTPSGKYAKRQMQLFGVELNALKKSALNVGEPGAGNKGGKPMSLDQTLDQVFGAPQGR